MVSHCCLDVSYHKMKNVFKNDNRCTQEGKRKIPNSALKGVANWTEPTLLAVRREQHRASRLLISLLAWLVKPRCAPSRRLPGSGSYGPLIMAMQEISPPAIQNYRYLTS